MEGGRILSEHLTVGRIRQPRHRMPIQILRSTKRPDNRLPAKAVANGRAAARYNPSMSSNLSYKVNGNEATIAPTKPRFRLQKYPAISDLNARCIVGRGVVGKRLRSGS